MTFFHATPELRTAGEILRDGLFCYQKGGLGGVAVRLNGVRKPDDLAEIERVTQENIEMLANPHRGYRFEVIICLPELSREQIAGINESHGTKTPENYFIQPRATKDPHDPYDGILRPEYILGFIDLDTGQFISREDHLRESKDQ